MVIAVATLNVKWLRSTWEAMNRIGAPVARNTGTSVAPVTPIWSWPGHDGLHEVRPPAQGLELDGDPLRPEEALLEGDEDRRDHRVVAEDRGPDLHRRALGGGGPYAPGDPAGGHESPGRDLEELASRGAHGGLSSHG